MGFVISGLYFLKQYSFMRLFLVFILFLSLSVQAQKFSLFDVKTWQARAEQVQIIRDTWGIAHVYGKTDADAVFGLLYAQCEDDFARVERNYITALGRMAEAEGEEYLYHDLRARMFMDSTEAIELYKTLPVWLKQVCNGFADGVNFYLYKHPDTKPKLLKRFKPWMPLLFSEGSIGGDIENVSVNDLKQFYGRQPRYVRDKIDRDTEPEPKGSNGIAIAPLKSASGNTLLLINPHTSFYFRSEVQVSSEEGLSAYGAVTWGQFFIYQGFNEHCGWMHTTSYADVVDEYLETIVKKDGKTFYKYGSELKPVVSHKIKIVVRKGSSKTTKTFTTFKTMHGPVISGKDNQWISIKMMHEPVKALTQAFQRTKASGFETFKNQMRQQANSSNNTVFADDKGNIAYWHGNYMPKRDTTFDWSKPVDGSNPATDYKGLHTVDQVIHVYNPATGWIQNCNSSPFTCSAGSSPNEKEYPTYMARDPENARGLHAIRVLQKEKEFTLDELINAAYDPYLPAFQRLIPSLVMAYANSKTDSLVNKLNEPMKYIREWDYRYSANSVATTLAYFWATTLRDNWKEKIPEDADQLSIIDFMAQNTSAHEKLQALYQAVTLLNNDFGNWKLPWGDVNRFQRLMGKIEQEYDDSKPSLAIPFMSSFWGSLAAYGAKRYPNTKKLYGNVGNSFVAAVEFGSRVRAKSVVTGGSSSDPSSNHFFDQASLYAQGKFKDVLYYKDDVMRNAERTYKPGE
jgi:acyl-homoserine-lactone acylase